MSKRVLFVSKCLLKRICVAFAFISILAVYHINSMNLSFMRSAFIEFNLEGLDEYPKVKIEYCRPIMNKMFLEVAVSPKMTDELEERIRDIGYYPYNSCRVRYKTCDWEYMYGSEASEITVNLWPPPVSLK